MKNSRALQILFFSTLALGLVGCPASTGSTTQQATDNEAVKDSSEAIAAAQPLPILGWSTQREVMTEAYINMAVPGKPFYMIATHAGAGDNGEIPIIAYATVKGCVPATFQLTQPDIIADQGHDYGYAILSQQEINAMYTGDTDATFCIGIDGTFFAIEHKVSFSSKPFSEVIRNRALTDYTPNVQTLENGNVVDKVTGEVLYEVPDEPIEVTPGVFFDPKTNEVSYDLDKIQVQDDGSGNTPTEKQTSTTGSSKVDITNR